MLVMSVQLPFFAPNEGTCSVTRLALVQSKEGTVPR